MIRVTIHPKWVAGDRYGYLYDVTLDGRVIVSRSPVPGYDAARALLALGHSGPFETVDCRTGKVRMRFADIEKAAELTVIETDRDGLRVVKWRPFPSTSPAAAVRSAAPARFPPLPVPPTMSAVEAPVAADRTGANGLPDKVRS